MSDRPRVARQARRRRPAAGPDPTVSSTPDSIARLVADRLGRAAGGFGRARACGRRRLKPPEPLPLSRSAVLLLGLPAQPLDGGARRARWSARASAATCWPWAWSAEHHRHHPRWATKARSGSASLRSPRRRTCSRTWATARSSTRAASPSDSRSRPASNITYKLLYNATVAMTGGQDAIGATACARADPAAARSRRRQADHHHHRRPRQLRRGASCPMACEVWHRDRLVEAQ